MVGRAWRFARPYRRMLLGYLGCSSSTALVDLVPPLLFRQIIDSAIPGGDGRHPLHLLAGLAVLAALGGDLALADRYVSSRIGEGVIYDLRVALFDHVQRMPVAFFTRTQTGALTSRLNNDVIGAQRALTGTLGSVVSNVITLVTTLVAMARPGVAAHAAVAGRAAAVHPPRQAGRAACRRSPASRWTSTPR